MAKRQNKKRTRKADSAHDAFFKSTFSHIEVTRDYIIHFMDKTLVKNLQLETLTLENNSYVTSELSQHFSDLVWSVQYKGSNIKIALLFEHKSVPEQHIHFQLIKYIIEHSEAQLKAKEPLTVVIPILIYHGDQTWKIREMYDYYEGIDQALYRYIPHFDYHLTDLSQHNDKSLVKIGASKLLNVFLIMRYIRDVNFIKKNFDTIFIHADRYLINDENGNFLRTLFVYLFKNTDISPIEIEEIVNNIHSPLRNFTMSTYDMLIEKGIEKGLNEKTRKVVMKLLIKYPEWNDIQIAELVETDVNFVSKLRKEVLG